MPNNPKSPSMPDFYKEWLMAQDTIMDLEGEVEKFKGALRDILYLSQTSSTRLPDVARAARKALEGSRK